MLAKGRLGVQHMIDLPVAPSIWRREIHFNRDHARHTADRQPYPYLSVADVKVVTSYAFSFEELRYE
jgi:hypothetical protein